jgi:hypothetical protein
MSDHDTPDASVDASLAHAPDQIRALFSPTPPSSRAPAEDCGARERLANDPRSDGTTIGHHPDVLPQGMTFHAAELGDAYRAGAESVMAFWHATHVLPPDDLVTRARDAYVKLEHLRRIDERAAALLSPSQDAAGGASLAPGEFVGGSLRGWIAKAAEYGPSWRLNVREVRQLMEKCDAEVSTINGDTGTVELTVRQVYLLLGALLSSSPAETRDGEEREDGDTQQSEATAKKKHHPWCRPWVPGGCHQDCHLRASVDAPARAKEERK